MNRSVLRKRVRNLIGEVLQEQTQETETPSTPEEPKPEEPVDTEITLTVAKGAYGTGGSSYNALWVYPGAPTQFKMSLAYNF